MKTHSLLAEMDSGVPDLETTYELVSQFPSQVELTPHRFWLTPMVNLVGDIRIHGRTILFNSQAEVLTEREKMIGDKLVPSGDVSSERQASTWQSNATEHSRCATKSCGKSWKMPSAQLRQPDWQDVGADAARQLQDLDLEDRPGRFERVYELLLFAVQQAATASDLLTLNSQVANPMNFQRSIPIGDDMEKAAVATVKLQGIRAKLQMKQLAKTLSLAEKGD